MPLQPRSPMQRFRALPILALGMLVAWTPVRAVKSAREKELRTYAGSICSTFFFTCS